MYVVPKGVRHNPVAEQECHVLLVERKSTAHTGEVVMERTRSIEEQRGKDGRVAGFRVPGSGEERRCAPLFTRPTP